MTEPGPLLPASKSPWMPRARAFGLLVGLYAAVQLSIFWRGYPHIGQASRETLGWWLLGAAACAWATVFRPRSWLAVAAAVCAAVHFWRFQQTLEQLPLPMSLQSAASGAVLLLAAAALAALLMSIRLLKGGQALALVLPLAAGAWGANVVGSARHPELVGRDWEPPFYFEGHEAERHEIAELGMRHRPHHEYRVVYASDPRGYFVRRPALDPLDAKRWELLMSHGAQGAISRLDGEGDPVRITMTARTADVGWHLSAAASKLPIVAGERYLLRLRIRADAPRPARLALNPTRAPFEPLGLSRMLELTPEWQEVHEEFCATRSQPDAALMLELGAADPAVEIAAVGMTPLGGRLDPMRWQSKAEIGARAKFTPFNAEARSFTVQVRHVAPERPGAVRVWQEGLTLAPGALYRLDFWARADRSRPISVSLRGGKDLQQNLGLAKNVQLQEFWQAFSVPFTVSQADADGQLWLMFGHETGTVEFADVALAADDPAHRFVPTRHYVECRSNAMGYRDDDHPEQPPAGEFRIVCLGDSYLFGQGVHEDDRLSNRLEKLLNETPPGVAPAATYYEVLNFGRSGFNTRQERLVYEHEASRFRPKLALVVMVDNDDVPWMEERQFTAMQKPSELERLFAPLGAQRKRRQWRADRRYTACVDDLELLKQRCDAEGVRLAAVIFPNKRGETWKELARTITEGVAPLDIPLLDLHEVMFAQHEDWELHVHPEDTHPNNVAHQIAAQALATFLHERRLLAPLRSAPASKPKATPPDPDPATSDAATDASDAAEPVP